MAKRKKKKKVDTSTKEQSEISARCPNCRSEKIRNNLPRHFRLKINVISVVIVFAVLAVWIQFFTAIDSFLTIYAVMLTIMVAFAAAKVYKKQYQCKNCKFAWDK